MRSALYYEIVGLSRTDYPWTIRCNLDYQEQKVGMALATISVLFCDHTPIIRKDALFMRIYHPWTWKKKGDGRGNCDQNLNIK